MYFPGLCSKNWSGTTLHGLRISSVDKLPEIKCMNANIVCEISYSDKNWMIKLGKLSRRAHRVIVKDFAPNCSSIGFVKAISCDNDLFVRSQGDDLVLEKKLSL
jgi:hypothetical protein